MIVRLRTYELFVSNHCSNLKNVDFFPKLDLTLLSDIVFSDEGGAKDSKWTKGEKAVILECFSYSRHECWSGQQKNKVFEEQINASDLPRDKLDQTSVAAFESIVSVIQTCLTHDEISDIRQSARTRAERDFYSGHFPEKMLSPAGKPVYRSCIVCLERMKLQGVPHAERKNKRKVTPDQCNVCHVALCRNCFAVYHTPEREYARNAGHAE